MTGENKITVEMTENEAELFVEFQKYRDVFQVLLNNGVFETRNGQAVLNFTPEGILADIRISTIAYKRNKLST